MALFGYTVHHFRMPVFFFLSGFLAALVVVRKGTPAFLKNRLRRIGLVWLLALCILYPVVYGISIYNHFALGSGPAGFRSWQAFSDGNVDPRWLHPPQLHLWFLEYLLLFSLLAPFLIRIAEPALPTLDGFVRLIVGSRLRAVILAFPTAALLVSMPFAAVPYPGSFLPWWQVALPYGWFYAVGWLTYRSRDVLFDLKRKPWLEVMLTPVLVLLNAVLAGIKLNGFSNSAWVDTGLAFSAALLTWNILFALMGLFQRFTAKPRPWLSYLSDASYWIYLCHFPIVLLAPALLRDWQISPALKVILISLPTVALLLWIYGRFIRYSVVGRTLSGTRIRTE